MLGHVSDDALLSALDDLVKTDTRHTARLLRHIAEVDARRAYLGRGFPSMYVYCTSHLKMDEGAAYNRIHAARASRQFPEILDRVAAGDVHLTAVRLLAPHLTDENHAELLAAARHRSKGQVEQLLAERFPLAERPTSIRKLPASRASGTPVVSPSAERPIASISTAAAEPTVPAAPSAALSDSASTRAVPPANEPFSLAAPHAPASHVTPIALDRWRIQTTVSGETQARLRRVQDLLRHRVATGDLSVVLDLALEALEQKLLAERFAVRPARKSSSKPAAKAPANPKASPATRTRHIPSETRRQVFARDGARCTFIGSSGDRCPETGFLQLDHVRPWSKGGPDDPSNVRLLCSAHNRHAAELAFGRDFMDGKRREHVAPETPERPRG